MDTHEKIKAQLIIELQELIQQNNSLKALKEKEEAELIIANKELIFQNEEKEKRAAELVVANKELLFQNEEKEKRAAELSENKTLLASVLDSSLSGIMAFKSIRNAEGAIMDFEWQLVNAAAEQMVSHSQTEILGKRLLEEMPGNRAEGLFDLYVKVVETGFPLSHEHYYEHEKVKTWFHTVAIKRLDGFVVTFSNITERKLAEQKLIVANKELAFQNDEKEKRAGELMIANKELAFQSEEKAKRAAELVIANKELAHQNREKEKRADELMIANKELLYQNEEKEKRANELMIANKELSFQNEEKAKRAAELAIANNELAFQITEHNRADKALKESEERFRTIFENSTIGIYRTNPEGQILLANPTLIKILGYSSFEQLAERNLTENGFEPSYERTYFMDVMKREGEVNALKSAWTKMDGTTLFISESARAISDKEGKIMYYDGVVEDITQRHKAENELIIANKKLLFQNEEKEKRAAELVIANKELVFQNDEKEKRAAELVIANKELAFQNEEKEKRTI
ncbi:MAG: PAS domain S-box protein, partial [Bacteroidales bacterium]